MELHGARAGPALPEGLETAAEHNAAGDAGGCVPDHAEERVAFPRGHARAPGEQVGRGDAHRVAVEQGTSLERAECLI